MRKKLIQVCLPILNEEIKPYIINGYSTHDAIEVIFNNWQINYNAIIRIVILKTMVHVHYNRYGSNMYLKKKGEKNDSKLY